MCRCPHAASVLTAAALGLAAALAQAEEPPPGGAPAAEAPRVAPAAAAPRAALRGAVVVAADDESAEAARSLARVVYRDPALRPPIDEAAAQALAGEPAPPDAPASVKELAEVRRSAGRAGSEPVARGLLASLGAGAGAALVVAVTTAQGHPVARVLHVAGARYAPLELGATVQRAADGAAASPAATIDWPGAAAALRALLPADGGVAGAAPGAGGAPAPSSEGGPVRPLATAAPTAPAGAALAQRGRRAPPAPGERRSVWSSPWFWGPLAGVAATGLVVLVLAQTGASDGDTVHLKGRIAP
ncbi:hypothetical protein SOCE26_085540 [Sorangium cellulosum]|uniref:Secreted protein n=1 Tax=Sorangium cellulosum TaxID=56 RepID=A0A2L0F685_SORCE|nr:hypothetical protein [Sorangium cellulosum]AUX47042.1 hypothetical protein SOCE26_085540 [Sorangium cellulosum]